MSEVTERVREYVKSECEKPASWYKGAFDRHINLVKDYCLQLAESQGANKEIVELAAWLHDIAAIQGFPENHHLLGAEVAEKFLSELNYPQDKIKKIKHCIISHRGSKGIIRESKEAQILADADAMSHFDDIPGLIRVSKELKPLENPKALVLEKLERSYAKLSDKAKPLVKEKLEKARKELV